MMICALIMAGGSGERFWPLSTPERPKQLLKLISDKTMIRETVDRILPLIPSEQIYIGTNIHQASSISDELPMIPKENIIIEPAFKDTAAAIGYGASYINNTYKNACLVVLASDHLISDVEMFRRNISIATEEAICHDTIVALGIKPRYPDTGYGYIETASDISLNQVYSVKSFREKPSREIAESYIRAGNFLWNSGIYVFNIDTIIAEIQNYLPLHFDLLQSIHSIILKGYSGVELSEKSKEVFHQFERISIDYGVMEKTNRIKVIPSDFGWNDIGSFNALREVLESDRNGNIIKNSYVRQFDSNNNIIITDDCEVNIVGVDNIIFVQKDNKILICNADRVQDIKKL